MRLLFAIALTALCVGVHASCPNQCSGRGDCSTSDLRCKCHMSIEQQDVFYVGGDCSLRTCTHTRVVWSAALCFVTTGPRHTPVSTPRTLRDFSRTDLALPARRE